MKRGLVQIKNDHDVVIQYQDHTPDSLNDVIVDTGWRDPMSVIGKAAPGYRSLSSRFSPSAMTT